MIFLSVFSMGTLFFIPHSFNEVVVEDMVASVVVVVIATGTSLVVVDVVDVIVASEVVVVIVTGTSPVVVDIMVNSDVVVVVVMVGAVDVAVTETQRLAGIAVHEVVAGSQVTFFVAEDDEQE